MKPSHFMAIILLLSLGLEGIAKEKIVTVQIPGHGRGCLHVNSKARKLYMGGGDPASGNWRLIVYDIDADGTVTGTDERVYPDPSTQTTVSGNYHSCASILSSPDGRRLYLGLQGTGGAPAKSLAVFDLDAKGEPKGNPRLYAIGNFHTGISHMLLDPNNPFLYTIGWGGMGLFTMPLKDGEPCDTPINTNFGYNAKTAMIPSDQFDMLIFAGMNGGAGAVMEVGGLGSEGKLEPPIENVPMWKDQQIPIVARVGKFLYYAHGNQLWVQPLSATWSLKGQTVKPVPGMTAVSVMEGVHPSLYVVLGELGPNPDGKGQKLVSTQIAQFKPGPDGQPGKPEFLSDPFKSACPREWTINETTGIFYVNLVGLP
jgi:hypothetical protein